MVEIYIEYLNAVKVKAMALRECRERQSHGST